jgi:hypothetical protein
VTKGLTRLLFHPEEEQSKSTINSAQQVQEGGFFSRRYERQANPAYSCGDHLLELYL